jgi:hypothetical protein
MKHVVEFLDRVSLHKNEHGRKEIEIILHHRALLASGEMKNVETSSSLSHLVEILNILS